jgi:hypothetical protein
MQIIELFLAKRLTTSSDMLDNSSMPTKLFLASRRKAKGNKMRSILKAAMSIEELANNLQQIAQDDKKEVNDYTDAEIVHEAKYILSCFHEAGHLNNEDYIGENGEEFQKSARDQVRKLNALIKKFG